MVDRMAQTSQILFNCSLVGFLLPPLAVCKKDLKTSNTVLLQAQLYVFHLQLDEFKVSE
jgi:hypothetical protein